MQSLGNLRKNDVTKYEKVEMGYTGSYFVTLPTGRAIAKTIDHKKEYAAYIIDRILGWGLVPNTVLREHYPHGQSIPMTHSFQHIVENATMWGNFKGAARTDKIRFRYDLMSIVFDYITDNSDRNWSNSLIDENGLLWAIDHGYCFHRARGNHSQGAVDFLNKNPEYWKGVLKLQRVMNLSKSRARMIDLIGKSEFDFFTKRLKNLVENAPQ